MHTNKDLYSLATKTEWHLSWFSLVGHQVPTKAALSLPLLNWTGEKKYDERLVGRDKNRETSLGNDCHGQNRLNLGKIVSFITNQIGVV